MLTLFKELRILIKMLFTSKPKDKVGKPMDLIVMKYFPLPGNRFMMWCGTVITRKDRYEVIKRFLNTIFGQYSRTHENGHCIQANKKCPERWLPFYRVYVWQWIISNPLLHPASSAYYTIPYEVEAYANERNPDYWKDYNFDNLHSKYTFKHRKKTYREHRDNWKEWLRSL